MENVYISHKNRKDVVLKCDDNIVPLSEVESDRHTPREKAFYVNVPNGYMGVYSSKDGPVLFLNNEKYRFSDKSWQVSVHEDVACNEVHFSNLSGKDISFKYEKVILDELDPWSQKEVDDFFIWLSLKRDRRGFIELWTD
jgi:hypothetical protein